MNVTINPVEWALDKIFEYDPNLHHLQIKGHPEMTPREWVRGRINWGIERNFTWFDGDRFGPTGIIMIRPVTQDMLCSVSNDADFWGKIFDFDLSGDICWVDFAYGHGLYPKFIRLCKRTEKEWICYRHKEKLRLVKMSDMPG